MSPDKLSYQANQIAKFFAYQGEEKTIAAVADHIKKYWEPRMRAAIYAHLDAGGAGLDPPVLKAVERLRQTDRAAALAPAATPR